MPSLLCDYCGHSLLLYNHEGCPDGWGYLSLGVDRAPRPCHDGSKAPDGPEPGRQT